MLRQLLHPVRSVKSLVRLARACVYSCFARHQFREIRREQRNNCWCGGKLLPFPWNASYGVCAECGCYVNRHPPTAEELGRLYSFALYWHTRQKLKGFPTIEHRPLNDWSDGRVNYWLDLITRFGPSTGRVIEVGCAHGVLLAELKRLGYECVGVEVDEETAAWTRENMGINVRAGLFPEVELPSCDLFLAFDVIEHCPRPHEFLLEVARLLVPGGTAIIQTPIEYCSRKPPFAEMHSYVFDDLEHLHVFTPKSIERLAMAAELSVFAEFEWRLAHEIVVFRHRL